MAEAAGMMVSDWRRALPVLTSRLVALREPTLDDLGPLVDLLSIADASRFGIDEPVTEQSVRQLIDRSLQDRSAGLSFTYIVTLTATHGVVGVAQVRQLDPSFEAAEWDMTLAPSVRGTGAFLEAARLIGSFAFDAVGAYRIEVRALLQNGRANGALTKLGAVQEGVLRRSVRRGTEYFDQVLWSILKDDWGDHRVSASRVH
jgi:RimJ/RimL family protein N-acetyltransferase